ncbi:MAG: DUF362 domain-containing protein, partial [Syntrophaceae bacterium]|nr:DUF362 domain-containing protein [Syntrophaceae bacterium]
MMKKQPIVQASGTSTEALRTILDQCPHSFVPGSRVGIKLHWGERGNHTFLHPRYAREIAGWLREKGAKPFVFDTTVLYSGARRTAADSLRTAEKHGFTEDYLGCPVVIGDGMDGRDVLDLTTAGKHFSSVQAAGIIRQADGFIIFSHFKGHMLAGFGGAIKNISMGMASRAQKQRMHADAHPELSQGKCTRCGYCAEVCPAGAAVLPEDSDPAYDLALCIGCSQCIALCPQEALKVIWRTDLKDFQERLVETAGAIWKEIGDRTWVINALIQIAAECDCWADEKWAGAVIAPDYGFIAGGHPVAVDEASLHQTGANPFDQAHEGLPWQR